MSLTVTGLVLLAAVLHSSWNAIAKAIEDKLATSALIALAYLLVGGVGVFVFPLPAAQAWPYIVASTIVQSIYLLVLTTSYKHGDFSQVYPLARGSAVVMVAVGAVIFLGQGLTPFQLLAVVSIAGALIGLAFIRTGGGHLRGAKFALLTGVCIATYSLVDGHGVRLSGDPMAYAMWIFALQGLVIPVICWVRAPDRAALRSNVAKSWHIGLAGGLLSLVAYAIVLWAQSVAPLAFVSALRECSVLLAGVIGYLFFNEGFSKRRAALTVLAVAGIAALQFSA